MGWLMPGSCAVCGEAYVDETGLCGPCLKQIPMVVDACPRCGEAGRCGQVCGACQQDPPWYDRVVSGAGYQGVVGRMVRDFKFSARLDLAPPLAHLLLRRLADEPVLPDLIIPVPLHSSRIRERGYNQGAILARRLSRALGVPCRFDLVARVRRTRPQTALARKQRQHNVRNAFVARSRVPAAHVAVVDDVMTTGGTVNEIARVLKRAGASEVSIWVVARAGREA